MTLKAVDAIIYTPLDEEFEKLRLRFKPEADINGDSFTGYMGYGPSNEKVVVVVGFEWGNDHSYKILKELLSAYKPRIAVCIGIGGGLSKDAKLGDVFYSSYVLDLTQRLKLEKDKKGINRTKYDPEPYISSDALKKALDRSRLSSAGTSLYKKWVGDCEMVNGGYLAGHNTSRLGHSEAHFSKPAARPGKIASTNAVLADENAVEDVRACGRKTACVDTEGAGFARACHEHDIREHIVIRGISDMADNTKKVTEEEFKNVFRNIAASNAALFLFNNFGLMLSAAEAASQPSETITITEEDVERTAIEANERSIKQELTRRSVAFKTLDKDYRMPVPRIRKENSEPDNTGEKKISGEQEIEDAVDQNSRILVRLPKHYPDTALPWLFAHLLTEPGNGERYPIPVCLRWSDYGPPRNNLDAHLEEKGLLFAKNNSSYRIVFIILDTQIGLKNKPQFLEKDFKCYDNACIILFQDRNENNVLEDEMSLLFQPELYHVESISFLSITNYVKANFGMTMDESEVLATRLVSTFNNFRIKVHPTYLASIQKDTVLSFIEANQRGELIELAVAGLLSLLVADDQSKVVLRRGTRERFLSRLAVSIYSEKVKYDEANLLAYVAGYAKDMGFDIDPKQFIKLFVDNGILTYEGGYIDIAVPVIRSYMLAKGLALEGASGIDYFGLDDEYSDISTFDLFCEFNDDEAVYRLMEGRLDQSIAYFEQKILLHPSVIQDGQFRSHLLSKSLNMAKVSEDISRKAADLVETSSLVSEKQAKLDVQAKIHKSRAAKSVDLSDVDKFKNEHVAIAHFHAATTMLGSAAEKMSDAFKLSLIAKIVKLGSLMATDLLTIYSGFDVNEIVADVIAQVKSNGGDDINLKTPEEEEEFREFVELCVGMWQFNLASNPIIWMITHLCESGRTNVLLSPIERTKTENKFDEFFRMTWAFDLDPVGKRRLPKELSKRLGTSPFLRMVFGVSMVHRSYWFHYGRDRKEAVAKGIDEMFLPLSLKSKVDFDEAKSE